MTDDVIKLEPMAIPVEQLADLPTSPRIIHRSDAEADNQMSFTDYKKKLEKTGYRFVGDHSAIKICEWTKKSITGKGSCYKQRFYGINSHQCAQTSVSVNFCDKDCIYCWRKRFNEPYKVIDDPVQVLDNIQAAQDKLLTGLGGYDKTDIEKFVASHEIKHFAISLTGETLSYPRINEFIKEIKKRGKTSFVVTHGGFPEAIEKLEPPTQLYLSLDAPNKELFHLIDRPNNTHSWERVLQSLDALKHIKEKTRTVIRLTIMQEINMIDPKGYADLIMRGEPHFLEIKAFMLIGASRERLRGGNMPKHTEVKAFAEEISKHCPYKIIDEAPESRVVLMMQNDLPERIMRFD